MKTCTECKAKMDPLKINKPACEALCSKCKKWFCYENSYPGGTSNMLPDDGTIQAKREYDGTTNFRY